MEGLLGRPLSGKGLRFTPAEFEAALAETRFGAMALQDLLEAYFGNPLTTNKNRAEQERQNREEPPVRLALLAAEATGNPHPSTVEPRSVSC